MIPKEQIYQITKKLNEDPSKILDNFNIEYNTHDNRFTFCCPVHNGDNPNGACLFNEGNWACWTNACHEKYGSNIIGFLQGILSCRNDEEISFPKTINCAMKIVGGVDFSIKEAPKTNREDRLLNIFNKDLKDQELPSVTRDVIVSKLNIPSGYYTGKLVGENIKKRKNYYKQSTMNKFDVGECMEKGKPMSFRVVVPFYNEKYDYVGCVGRKLFEDNDYPKWINSSGLKTSNVLYGLNISSDFVRETSTIALVEGQGDVWRCYEAGMKNSAGIAKAFLSDEQLIILEKIGVQNIILLTDYDEAGENAADQIRSKCGRRFNYHRPKLPTSLYKKYGKLDVGELSNEEVKEFIIDKLPRNFKCKY